MKALGRGSIASIIRVGLLVAWVVLWMCVAGLILGAIACSTVFGLINSGSLDPSVFGPLLEPTENNPAGVIWPVVVIGFLVGGVSIGGGLIIVSRLRSLFDSFTTEDPFRRENATHLRVIWITMLVVEVARIVLMTLISALVSIFGPTSGVGVGSIEFSFELTTWASILILIVLAEVFREGARLKEEQELTI